MTYRVDTATIVTDLGSPLTNKEQNQGLTLSTKYSIILTVLRLHPFLPHFRVKLHLLSAMVFGKGLRSKMEKMFSSPSQDPEVVNDPPPPYALPQDFVDAGIKEDDLAILRDYDTVIILDDSGSMEPLWSQVNPLDRSPPDRTDC